MSKKDDKIEALEAQVAALEHENLNLRTRLSFVRRMADHLGEDVTLQLTSTSGLYDFPKVEPRVTPEDGLEVYAAFERQEPWERLGLELKSIHIEQGGVWERTPDG